MKEDIMNCFDSHMASRLMYVALSRAKHKAIIG
jgi:ATP-dependent exoDNAse (exonuclease V) beta subunit